MHCPHPAPRLENGVQRRWWFDVGASRKNYDKPAYTGSRYVFVRGQVPVVMLQTVRGVGQRGQIVSVKRGFARHHLVPKGLAVFGTWENIDMYADPALVDDPSLQARAREHRGRLPFDWVDEIDLLFVRWAREDDFSVLLEPITIWDVLMELSTDHELDLLPGNLEMPEEGFSKVGEHEVAVKIAFRNPESAAGRYTIRVEIVSQQSRQDELRREEMARAVEESRRFVLPQNDQKRMLEGGFDEEDDDDDAAGGR